LLLTPLPTNNLHAGLCQTVDQPRLDAVLVVGDAHQAAAAGLRLSRSRQTSDFISPREEAPVRASA
jgi:hypothetical protein